MRLSPRRLEGRARQAVRSPQRPHPAVFVAFLVEFLLVRGAAHAVFFTLMLISLVDVLAGFSVSLRAAGRDVNLH